jgi:hypothetical protein
LADRQSALIGCARFDIEASTEHRTSADRFGEAPMLTRKRLEPKPKKRRRPGLRSGAASPSKGVAVEEEEREFDEPASPARQGIVSVEEPTASPQRTEDPNACGSAGETRTDPSDLH